MLASTVDSFLDILASSINFFSLRESAKPPDAEHRYGHGKIESLAAMFQACIIFGSALFIMYQAILHFIEGTHIQRLEEGIIVMLISTVTSIYIAHKLKKVGNETDSTVLQTDALHYTTDIYQNIGIVLTITVIYFTGWQIIDTIVGLTIGIYIIFQVWKIFKKAVDCLMDHELPEKTKEKIHRIIISHSKVNDYHNLRTRKAGETIFINFDLVLSSKMKLAEAHDISHQVEALIHHKFPHAEIMIHIDPYDDSKQDEQRQEKVYKNPSRISK